MTVWRICKKRHVDSALSGIGAEITGGRWNEKGHRVVYTSGSIALATLELLVHVSPHDAPADLVLLELAIPDDVSQERVQIQDWIFNWRSYPAPAGTIEIGTEWINNKSSLLLAVPSAVTEGSNFLINPAHDEIKKVQIVGDRPFEFDPRLIRKK